jgi:hypothetical protein
MQNRPQRLFSQEQHMEGLFVKKNSEKHKKKDRHSLLKKVTGIVDFHVCFLDEYFALINLKLLARCPIIIRIQKHVENGTIKTRLGREKSKTEKRRAKGNMSISR